jgi:hypothetical protein
LAAIIRSRTAPAKNDDSESRKRRTDDSAKPLLVKMINARVISRSVTALIDKAPNAVDTKRGSAASAVYVLADIECFRSSSQTGSRGSYCSSTRPRIDASRKRRPLAGQPGLSRPLGVEGPACNVTASGFEDS